ncbi:hypothetical protein ABZ297_24065 [Nonomuraea sp. NPDC005983]|uniref:hypothetical protein n=1 Tax=Nonomuraea sp. NPDC005983 TaxID=3155595 RepID=UPI0033BBF0A8
MAATKPEDRLLDVARAQLGYTESPTGWTAFGSWWAKRHDKPASWALEPGLRTGGQPLSMRMIMEL